jgi:hypothetical protein
MLRRLSYLVVEALVGTEHHSATRQTLFHSGVMNLLLRNLHFLEAMRAFDLAVRTVGLVVSEILAEDSGFTILTVGDLELAFLKKKVNQQ